MLNLLANEPALASGLVAAAIMLAVAFGVPITDAQKSAILGLVGAGLAILSAVYTRSQVTPTINVTSSTPTKGV